MKLAHFFIERPIFAGVLSVLIFIGGAIAAFTLPVAEYPEVSPPTIVVSTQYPGANPQVVAETVAAPLEQEIVGVEDMIYMNSQAQQDGTLQLSVVFELGADIDRAQVLVQNRVSQALPRLPAEVRAIGVTTRKSSPDLTMVVHLYSPDGRYDGLYLRNYAVLQVRDALARLHGAGDVRIFGAGDYAMRVWLDPQKLASRQLTASDVIAAIREQNVQVAAGSVGGAPVSDAVDFQLAVNTQGRLRDEQEFGDIVVKTSGNGEVTRLHDVARIELGAGEYALRSLLDNRSAVAIPVFLQPGANALDLAADVRSTMAELKTRFPEGVDYQIIYDPTVFISDSIDAVVKTLFEATLLVVIVVLLFLQTWRAALIPIIAVPVSIIGTLGALQAFGFSLNTLTLFGLVLSVGIVVDDAIVVVENVERGIRDGLTPRKAAHRSMDEVSGPIIAMTLVLCAVFVPAAFSGGFEGQFYQQFALTIAFAALISAVNSLTLSPALSALLLRPHDAAPDRVQRGIDAAFGWLFRPFNRLFDRSASGYQRGVRKVLRAGGIGLAVYAGLLGLTALGFVQAPKGFVPTQDKGYLITIVQLPPSASIERTEAVVRRIGEIALEQPGVANAVQFPGLSINGFTRTTNSAIVFTPLTPFEERGTALSGDAIAQALGAKFAEIDDAFVLTIAPPPVRGFGPAGGFKLQIEDRTDQGADALFRATQELAAKARQTPGLVGVFTNYEINAPQLYADVDRVKAKQLGIDLNELFTTLQAYLGSYYVNDFNRFGRTFRVLVQADEPFRDRADDVLLLQTRNAAGQMVPLGSVLSLRDSYGPTTVQRYNGFPSADLNGMPAPGYSSGEAIAIIDRLAAETLPPGMTYDWTEITYQQVVASGALGIVLVLGVLFVFLVLAAQYESLSLPLAIILIVPMSLLSALAGIYLTGSDINIFTQIGLFVLMGLAAKNAILIVEFARELQHQGMGYVEAALEACRLRLRPILMTSFAFILGVLPLAIATGAGAEIQRAMGIAVFFGMLGVTFFGLFLTPLFYVVIRHLVEGRGAAATPAADAASPAPALPGH
ncbi:efflux RND transporter permease subunit [Sinimarinibacterium flocculans]|uniref:Efflux pump membrane transporter n=1 Tax=Sinimarinibacterium flocculans TaxID=985250 RepID=A0A318E832_9GAMM|nr:multidrug efflux RND transporter permease subunit [Sinimarinibacterium flocculans]PXV67181.1 multidrug efflux pump [Sinimarinibacterium flocculans]